VRIKKVIVEFTMPIVKNFGDSADPYIEITALNTVNVDAHTMGYKQKIPVPHGTMISERHLRMIGEKITELIAQVDAEEELEKEKPSE